MLHKRGSISDGAKKTYLGLQYFLDELLLAFHLWKKFDQNSDKNDKTY